MVRTSQHLLTASHPLASHHYSLNDYLINDAVMMRPCDDVAPLCCGTVVMWGSGAVALWYFWCCGTVVLWHCGAMALWCRGLISRTSVGYLILMFRSRFLVYFAHPEPHNKPSQCSDE